MIKYQTSQTLLWWFTFRYWICIVIAVVLLVLILTLSLTLTKRRNETPTLIPTVTPSGNCDEAAVAADADAGICSNFGRDMLKRGGSVVDAAIAALLCVSVVNPYSMGIGGGVVFTIYNPSTGIVEIINARETAPLRASENMFGNDPEQAKKAGLLIAVPGELRGYHMAHQKYGRLEWKELFQPSIELANKGFKIGKGLADAINENSQTIRSDFALCEVFCDLNNNTLKENDTIRFPKLALTYKVIAEEGPDAFYNGTLTQIIVDDINAKGGIITRKDLEDYKPQNESYALNFTVGKYIFHAPNTPFGGPVLALILNILKGKRVCL
ncbi:hypothetical protein PO909_017781 [Leuciscus waleckii]